MTRSEETKAVKNALKAAGFDTKVTHGKGTAWGWIDIRMNETDYTNDNISMAEKTAVKVLGRDTWHENQIIISD